MVISNKKNHKTLDNNDFILYICPVKQSQLWLQIIHLKKKEDMRINLEEWAKEYAKRKKKNKKKSPMAKLYGLYKGKIFISKDAFDYRIIPLNELSN